MALCLVLVLSRLLFHICCAVLHFVPSWYWFCSFIIEIALPVTMFGAVIVVWQTFLLFFRRFLVFFFFDIVLSLDVV